jgi:hypothetical protein
VKLDERRVIVVWRERQSGPPAFDRTHPEHSFVVTPRALEILDLQACTT